MIIKREEHSIVMGPDHKLYAIGGFDGKTSLSASERYNFKSKKWERISNMNYCRRSLCAVSLPDGIYAIGGYDDIKYMNLVERYDIEKNCWINMPKMRSARCAMAATATTDYRYIFVIGGYDGEPLNCVERYDTVEKKWEVVSSMKKKRFMHGAVIGSICIEN